MRFVEADGLLRVFQQTAERIDLLAQGLLPLAGRLQFFLDHLPAMRLEIGAVDLALEFLNGVAADATLEALGQAGVDHLGQAS